MSNTKKPAFNADAAEEYFSDLLFYYKKTGDDIFNRDNEGRHSTNFIYSAEYQKYVGMQIAMREVLEYFSKYDLADVQEILGDNYDLDRLREIVDADREGRCFTTTVKVGDYIFFPYDGEIVMCRVQGISLPVHGKNLLLHLGGYPAVYMWSDRENIDWWKTREAAEKNLKKEG